MKKCVLALLLSVLLVCGFALPVCAETVVKDGIEVTLTTDKESYDSLDVIDAKLTVKNTNSFDVENVSMEIKAPEGYMLTSDGETKIGELSAGETQQQQTGMRDAEAPAPVLPQTGDNSHGMLWGLLFVLSSAAVCVLVIRHPQGKRIISLLLCVALVAPYMLEMAPALAQEELATEMIMVSKEVLVNGEKVELTGMVTYQAAEMKFAEKTENTSAFGLKINEIADSVKVREGDKLSFTGTISAAEGEVISAVQVFVYDATTEVPYTMGEKYYEAEGLNVAQFDLASVPEMNVGEAFGESDYALTEGGRYAVMFYATDSKGNSFADMDLSISGNQGPVINVRVLMNPANCDHSAKEYTYVRDDSTTTRVTDNEDGLTHQVEPSYERYCADCGMYLMNIWGQGTNADHTIVDGMCTGCGYAPIMLMQEIPSICFDSLEKSEYEVFEEVLITWEEREETDDYVVYVKILDGEPASGSDNEKGELLLSDSNVRFANYSFTVPDRAAGKWIKINVHGKNRQGEQTEAASSIYIFAKESGNKDLGEVILKATKSGSKVLFTVEGNANEVRLYKSEQIHAGSQLRDGVADMYYESFSHSAPHTFSHETSGYHSNKSYLFCVKTDDGRVSNKVFVAGTEICENVPSISEVTLNRSEARLGDPIKIESGTVYGNDLRIYGVNAYMYNENSEIQPVAWDSGYVWKEDIDLSPFDLSSFGAYATKSFMEGLSEPGCHNIYVHIMCYGNVSFTFPTSAEIYLYDEETECCHTEYTDFDNSQIKYTDNGDGKTHTWQNGYNRTCNACSANMGVVYGEENTAPHDYTNGDVCLCGYDRNACNHEPVALEYVKHIFEPIAGDNVNHRIAGVVYKATCGNCQKAYEVIYKDKDIATGETFPREAAHDAWNDGVCGTCGYECVHTFETMTDAAGNPKAEPNSGVWASQGEQGHKCASIKYWHKCTNCGLEETYEKMNPYGDKVQEHMLNALVSTGYNYNETEHWIVGYKMRCTALGCGYEEFVEVDNAVHDPHQFYSGYCTVCGRATPYYSAGSSGGTSDVSGLSNDAQMLLNNLKKYENQLPKESFYYFDELHYDKFIGAYLEDELTQQIWDEGGVEGKVIAIGGAAYVLGMNTQAGLQGALAGLSNVITGAVSGVVDLATQSGMTEEEKKQKKTADEILAILKDKSEEIKDLDHETVSISETANEYGNALIGWAKLLVGTFEQGFNFKDTEVLEAVHEALKGSRNIGNTSKVSSLYDFYSGIKVRLRGTEIPLTKIFGFTTEADAEAGKAFKSMMQRIKKTDDLGKLTTEMGKIQDSYNGKKWNLDALGGGSGKFEFDKFGMTADTVLGFINLYVETQSMNMIYDDWYGAIESKLNDLDPESEAYKAIEEVLNSIYKYDGNLELGEIGSLVLEGGQIVGNAAVATLISGGIKAVSFPATIVVEGALLASAIGNVDEKASALFDLPDYIDDYRFKREEYVKAINNYMQNPTNNGYFDVVEKANDLYWATELADNCALRYQRAVDDTLWINNGNVPEELRLQDIPEYEQYQKRINAELKQTRDYFEKLGIWVTSINAL